MIGKHFDHPVLLGDIGATNARFAVIDEPQAPPEPLPVLQVRQFDGIEAALAEALSHRRDAPPRSMILAIAAPLIGDTYHLVNAHWAIDPSLILAQFDLARLSLMNDFVAQGLAALAMPAGELEPVGDVALREGLPKMVLGPGTGLGTVHLVPLPGRWLLLPSEAGHVDFGPSTPREAAIWPHLRSAGQRVFAETVISGPGLETLHAAICAADGRAASPLDAAAICAAAAADEDGPPAEAVRLFLSLLARHAGNLALTTLAMGGVYLAGGMVARTLPFMDKAAFRQVFEAKDPYEPILRQIGIAALPDSAPAFEGLIHYLRNPERFEMHVAMRQFLRR